MTSSINGIGSKLYGKCEIDADGSYITTKWFILAFIPILPMSSMRVLDVSSSQYQILEELPINWGQVFRIWAYALVLLFLIGKLDDAQKHPFVIYPVVVLWLFLPMIARSVFGRR